MILGIGIDVTMVSRFRKWIENPHFMERYFSAEECAIVRSRGSSAVRSLAVRFAAKEAFGKALGTGLAGIELKDISVLNENGGKPVVILKDTALNALQNAGGSHVHVSLSHEKDIAAAIVIIESE